MLSSRLHRNHSGDTPTLPLTAASLYLLLGEAELRDITLRWGFPRARRPNERARTRVPLPYRHRIRGLLPNLICCNITEVSSESGPGGAQWQI